MAGGSSRSAYPIMLFMPIIMGFMPIIMGFIMFQLPPASDEPLSLLLDGDLRRASLTCSECAAYETKSHACAHRVLMHANG